MLGFAGTWQREMTSFPHLFIGIIFLLFSDDPMKLNLQREWLALQGKDVMKDSLQSLELLLLIDSPFAKRA